MSLFAKQNPSAASEEIISPKLRGIFDQCYGLLEGNALGPEEKRKLVGQMFEGLQDEITKKGLKAGWKKQDIAVLTEYLLQKTQIAYDPDVTLIDLRDKVSTAPSSEIEALAAQAVTGFKNVLQQLEKAQALDFGLVTAEQLGSIRDTFGVPNAAGAKNPCAPIAIYYLVQATTGLEIKNKEAQKAAFDKLLSITDPDTFGTRPEKIAEAFQAVVGAQAQIDLHKLPTAEAALNLIKSELSQNRPCLVKYGASLTSQHYDCIIESRETSKGTVFLTSSGLLIPESRLLNMIDQKPAANHVWTVSQLAVPSNRRETQQSELKAQSTASCFDLSE